MSYEIRKATLTDTEELTKLFNSATQRKLEHGDTAWGTLTWTTEEVDDLLSHDITLVAKADGVLAGTVTVGLKDERAVWDDAPAVYVHKLAGDSSHKGIGRVLLDSAAIYARENNIHLLRLDCNASVNDLCAYYEKVGFTKIKTVPTEEDGTIALFEKSI